MNISEDSFVSWSQGPAATEAAKCENAETAVRKAIAADSTLSKMDVSVFAQGSYKARTNVRQDSDVDICVRYNEAFYDTYPDGKKREDFGNGTGNLKFSAFKPLVQAALQSYFGANAVTPGNKAFDVHANTYRIDADVLPTFEYRRYTGRFNADGSHHFFPGVTFFADQAQQTINWPQQTYDNGVARNTSVAKRYKRSIRIFKRLRNRMQEDQVPEAKDIASFLIECLAYNCPLAVFQHDTYTDDVRAVIIAAWNATKTDESCSKWLEVNELKWLFRPTQPWTRDQAHKFMQAAWNYIGFK
jgi:hypothetical protein